MNWQPIETAPRDGTNVILWRPDYIEFGYFSGGAWRICNNGNYHDGGYGKDYVCGTEHWRDYAPPTHWMPLPAPPEE